jgi:hypothetical protein
MSASVRTEPLIIDPPNRRAFHTDVGVGQLKPTSRYAKTTVTPWATTQPTLGRHDLPSVVRLVDQHEDAQGGKNLSSYFKNAGHAHTLQTLKIPKHIDALADPQIVLAQNSAREGATWWVNGRETRAPPIHKTASRNLAPKTPEIRAESRSGSLRWREVSREAEISKPYSTTLAMTVPIA